MTDLDPPPPTSVGRYLLYDELATGGMGSVYLGRMRGPAGFGKMVAIKRLHAHLAREESFKNAFIDEARVASRVLHPNVVQTLDVVSTERELFLVMELVLGEPLFGLFGECRRAERPIPRPIALGLVSQILQGLHAAHEALDEQGRPLGIIHRDVSPQNVLVGIDGVARLIDFGVAKANGRLQTTEDGVVKGKFAYMAPEHITGGAVDRRADVYSASVILWELLAGQRLFDTADKTQIMFLAAQGAIRRPTAIVPELPEAIEDIVMKGLERSPDRRYATAHEMALALEAVERCASPIEIASWVASIHSTKLDDRRKLVARVESTGAHLLDDGNDAVALSTKVPTPRRSRTLGVAFAALVVATIVGGAAFYALRPTPPAPPTAAATSPAPPEASSAPRPLASAPVVASPSVAASITPTATARPTAAARPTTTHATARPTATAKSGDGLFPRN